MQQEDHSLSEDKPPSYIDLHTHSFMSGDGVLRVQNIFPDVSGGSRLPEYFSIGIHPKNIDPEFIDRDLAIMDRVLAENRSGGVVAVGECGLDKFSLVDFETQEKVFVAQIQLALKYDLPMVIHSVRSWQEIIRVKKQYARKQTWVVHGFRSSIEAAESLIRHNILLSFGEAVTEEQSKLAFGKKAQNVRLCSKLIGWNITIQNEEPRNEKGSFRDQLHQAAVRLASELGISEGTADLLISNGYVTVDGVKEAGRETLLELDGINADEINRAFDRLDA